MFLKEIPAEYIVETRPRAGILRPAYAPPSRPYGSGGGYSPGSSYPNRGGNRYDSAPSRTATSAATANEVPGGYKLGARVRHAKFGEGTILTFDGDGDRMRVEVRFREAGTKWLMLAQARLESL